MDYMLFPILPGNYKELSPEEYVRQCNEWYEKMKATLDKHIGDRYHGVNDGLENIIASFHMKQDIELEGHILRRGTRGFVVNNNRSLTNLFSKGYLNSMPIADRAFIAKTNSYPMEDIVQSFVPEISGYRRETLNPWDYQDEVFDEYEVDRFYELTSVFSANMAGILFGEPLPAEDNYSRTVREVYEIAPPYANAIDYMQEQNISLPAEIETEESSSLSDNEAAFSHELANRRRVIEIVGAREKDFATEAESVVIEENGTDRLSLAKPLPVNPRDTSAILAYEPFTAAQAKDYMKLGLHFYHVGLVRDGIPVAYQSDLLDDKSQLYLIPTTKETIDTDLEQYGNDFFVVDKNQMLAEEVRAMKFVFHAIDNWNEIDLPEGFVSDLMNGYAESNESFSTDVIATLRDVCFPPQTMAAAVANHGYTMPELIDLLYPANTSLAQNKQERIEAQQNSSSERFTVIDATYAFTEYPEEPAFAVWDNEANDYYQENNVIHTFPDMAEAEQYKAIIEAGGMEKSFSEQVDDTLKGDFPFYSSLKVCDTPPILIEAGCEPLPMLYSQRHLKKAVRPENEKRHEHGLKVEQIKKLPELLASPVMICDSLSRDDSIVIITSEFDTSLNPIIVSVRPNGIGRYELEEVTANYITSVYGKDNFSTLFDKFVDNNKLLYLSKEKSQDMFERWGLQLPELTNNLNFDSIIHKSNNIVKENETISETLDTAAAAAEDNRQLQETPDYPSLLSEHEEHISALLQEGKPTVIINAFAGPGAGKSTACLDICAGLKKAGYSAEYVQEYAKELVYEGSELLDGTSDNQYKILLEQLHRQDRFLGAVDFVVTDSPILLNGIYNREITPEYSEMLSALYKQYDTSGAKNFCFFVKRDTNPEHFEQTGRLQDFTESMQKDNEVKDMLSEHNIYYGSYDYDSIQKVVTNAIRTREKHIQHREEHKDIETPKNKPTSQRGQSSPKKHFYTEEESAAMLAYLKDTVSIVDVISEWEPVVRKNNRYFEGKNHDSLVIDTKAGKNCFHWNSMNARGSVIDACMTFGDMEKTEAISYLYDMVGGQEAVYEYLYGGRQQKITYEPKTKLASIESTTPPPGEVVLPPKSDTRKNVYAYLGKTRCLHPNVIQEFFDRNMLYQDTYKNCVFVAHDKTGKPNFAVKRGTNSYKRFIADCKGNDYSSGFYVDNGSTELFVGESVIDIMSKMSLLAEKGIDYHKYNYLAMAGTEKQEPLINILSTYPENTTITLGLDNDKGGRTATTALQEVLAGKNLTVKVDVPDKEGQDWNDYLKEYVNRKGSSPNQDFEKTKSQTPFDKQKNPIKDTAQKKQAEILPQEQGLEQS